MSDVITLARDEMCIKPDAGKLITAFSFGHATYEERRLVATHLLECDSCWREASHLENAVRVLDTDASLISTLTPNDIGSTLGISGRLNLLFGGHYDSQRLPR